MILYVGVGLVGAVMLAAAVLAIVLMRRRRNRRYPGPAGAPPFPTRPNQAPPYTSGPMPVFDPAASAWTGPQSPAPPIERTEPTQVGVADRPHATVVAGTAPAATAPVAFDSRIERAGLAGHDGKTSTDEGAKIEHLKTLAALRDSGVLTEVEFETEKRKILDVN